MVAPTEAKSNATRTSLGLEVVVRCDGLGSELIPQTTSPLMGNFGAMYSHCSRSWKSRRQWSSSLDSDIPHNDAVGLELQFSLHSGLSLQICNALGETRTPNNPEVMPMTPGSQFSGRFLCCLKFLQTLYLCSLPKFWDSLVTGLQMTQGCRCCAPLTLGARVREIRWQWIH